MQRDSISLISSSQKEEIKEYIDEGSVVLADFFSQNGDLERGLSYLQEVKSSEGLFVKASVSFPEKD